MANVGLRDGQRRLDQRATETAALQPKLVTDALLVFDANPIYTAFSDAEGFSYETVNLSQSQRINGAYHVQNVNAYHSRVKQRRARFHGVATHYLSNYLGWRLLNSTAKSNRKHC